MSANATITDNVSYSTSSAGQYPNEYWIPGEGGEIWIGEMGDGNEYYAVHTPDDAPNWSYRIDPYGILIISFGPNPYSYSTQFSLTINSNNGDIVVHIYREGFPEPLVAGSLTTSSQSIVGGTNPMPTIYGTLPSGGNGTYSYQWYQTVGNSTSAIAGAQGKDYTPSSSSFTATTTYYRSVTSRGETKSTNTVTFTFIPVLAPGSITTASQEVIKGNAVPVLAAAASTGGTGSYTYQWEQKPVNGSWTTISGATAQNYTPSTLTATTTYRRKTVSGTQTLYTNEVTYTYADLLNGGTISTASQQVSGNSIPVLTATAASGGTGSYAYQWEQKPVSGSWTNINGATAQNYTPTSLTTTTTYRRRTVSGGQTSYTNEVTYAYAIPLGAQPLSYISTRRMLDERGTKYLEQVGYYDGLGRPVQTVHKGITPGGKDLADFYEYDAFGRESLRWLPVESANSSGAYVTPATVQSAAKAYYVDNNPHSKPVYETSPLNRVMEQYGPGADWQVNGKSVVIRYLTNLASGDPKLVCARYEIVPQGFLKKGNYDTGQLYVTETADEDGNLSYEFKDKLGRVVLTRQLNNGVNHDTYSVYDDFGNLGFVLPPLAADALTADNVVWNKATQAVKDYGYRYRYDHRNRCTVKQLPGADSICYVYDKADRLIFTQDGEQRTRGEWFFIIPDAFGRTVFSGTCTHLGNAPISTGMLDGQLIQAQYTGANGLGGWGYTLLKNGVSVGLTGMSVLTVNYYDNYNFRGLSALSDSRLAYTPDAAYGTRHGSDADPGAAKTLLTGSFAAALGGNAPVYSAFYYDSYKRPVQTARINHLGCRSRYDYKYDFVGNVLASREAHQRSANGAEDVLLTGNEYDHAGRLVSSTVTLNGGAPATMTYTYNELGQLSGKNYGEPDVGNLFSNESFEDGQTVFLWPHNISAEIVQGSYRGVSPRSGNKMLACSWGITDSYVYINQAIPVTPGKEYCISFWAYSQGAGGISSSFIYDSKGDHYHRLMDFSPGWKQYVWSFTPEAGVTWIKLRFGRYNAEPGGWSCFDDIRVVRGNAAPLIETLSYNIRGWMRERNSPFFNMKLRYNNPVLNGSGARWNGNISEWEWQQKDPSVGGGEVNAYAFTYDGLSRLKETGQYVNGSANNRFTERGLSYDKQGNMLSLQRTANAALRDNFTYAYSGNQLTKLSGTESSAYTYDANGNLKKDSGKDLAFTYNLLNLTQEVRSAAGALKARYTYLADGTKCAVAGSDGRGFDYLGSLVYERNGSSLTLESAAFPEGRIYAASNGYIPRYFIKDHLGSVRVEAESVSNGLEVTARHDYYPFGLRVDGGLLNAQSRFLYNGKEKQIVGGLDFLDLDARMYDPKYARILTHDPLSKEFPNISPYAYCLNNPVRFTDPTGMSPEEDDEKEGKSVWQRIEEIIKNLFSINIDLSSPQTIEASFQRMEENAETIQQATDVVNMYAEGMAAINPLGSVITTVAKVASGAEVKAGDVVSAAMEVIPVIGVAKTGAKAVKGGARIFFEGAKYSDKVFKQMNKVNDIYHAFPQSVDGYATKFGQWSTKVGKDGKVYQWLKLPGSYEGKSGTFEYIKDANGVINHRYFNVP